MYVLESQKYIAAEKNAGASDIQQIWRRKPLRL